MDDRVHPAHARKMVARMQEQGHDVSYFENTEGGHGRVTMSSEPCGWGLSLPTFGCSLATSADVGARVCRLLLVSCVMLDGAPTAAALSSTLTNHGA